MPLDLCLRYFSSCSRKKKCQVNEADSSDLCWFTSQTCEYFCMALTVKGAAGWKSCTAVQGTGLHNCLFSIFTKVRLLLDRSFPELQKTLLPAQWEGVWGQKQAWRVAAWSFWASAVAWAGLGSLLAYIIRIYSGSLSRYCFWGWQEGGTDLLLAMLLSLLTIS